MSKGKVQSIPELIRVIAADRASVTAGEVAKAAGVSRQAAHYHLVRMVREGELRRVGAGRGSRYVPDADLDRSYPLEGLEEDRVWDEVVSEAPKIRDAPSNVLSIMRYAFTEMLNNAIDHSGGTEARVKVWARDPLSFEINDDGVGAFRHVRERLELPDDLAALQQISKGRETTAPDRHSGEGIFFTSKAVDLFELDANRLRWIVDNSRGDQAIGEGPEHAGTRVRCDVDPATRSNARGGIRSLRRRGLPPVLSNDRPARVVRDGGALRVTLRGETSRDEVGSVPRSGRRLLGGRRRWTSLRR
jgi:hypothetical protein